MSRIYAILLAALAAPAYAVPTALGVDSSINLLVLGNMNVSSSDVQGRVAVAGNASISSYSIDTKSGSTPLYTGTGLTVGGNLNFSSGSVYGDTRVGGNVTSNYSGTYNGNLSVGGNLYASSGLSMSSGSSATVWGSQNGVSPWYPTVNTGSGTFNLGFDFQSAAANVDLISSSLGQLSNTGTVTDRWGTLVLDASGSNAGTVIFNLSAAQAAMNMEIDGLGPNTTAVINVAGSNVNFGNHGYTNFSDASGRVLFNLYEATAMTFNGGVTASILAPLATVGMGWGVISGQVIVNNWNTSVQVNDASFSGSLPSSGSAHAIPEPTVPALLLLSGLAWRVCRRRAV